MADLQALKELCVWMREANVLHARMGDLELHLAPQLPMPSEAPDEPKSALEAEKEAMRDLLYSSGVDPAPFLRRYEE